MDLLNKQHAVQKRGEVPRRNLLSGARLAGMRSRRDKPGSRNCNRLPNPLKTGLEQLSGFDLSDVRVHVNSPEPARLRATSHIQGRDIHLARMTRRAGVSVEAQSNLNISSPGDRCEREADRLADQVMRMPQPSACKLPAIGGFQFSHNAASSGLVRKVHNPSGVASDYQRTVLAARGGGRPLSQSERSFFEPRFGVDFSLVRIRDDARADAAARAVGAMAYTLGSDVVFRSGAYKATTSGRHLLAHELSHVVQQNALGKRAVLQRKRAPDIVHKGYNTFYLRTGAGAKELAVQFYYSGKGSSVTVKIAHLQSRTMQQGTFTLTNGAAFDPKILVEARGVTTLDIDGDGKEDMQVLTSVEKYSKKFFTTMTTPSSGAKETFNIKDVYALAQFGSTKLVISAAGLGLPERAIWSPRWIIGPHPHPNISHVWRDTKKSRYHIPPMGGSMEGIKSPPEFIRSTLFIASRSSWSARAPITNDPTRSYETYTKPLTSIYDSIVVHHSGNKGYKTMAEVQNHHMDGNDARADIGYHFGIGLSGRVYTGRPLTVKGSHVAGANTGKIGIVLLADLDTQDEGLKFYQVDFSDDSMSDRMQASLVRLVEHLKSKFPGIIYLGGHKEFDKRRHCPGNLTMDRISTFRSVTGLQAPP